jgi:hypothetical protein
MTPRERVFGSERFRSLTRKPDLPSPVRFEPTQKRPEDIVI